MRALLAVALVATSVTFFGVVGSVGTASATVPGTPGVPQAGTPIYDESFSNQDATTPVSILNYTGSAGTSGADGESYTADPDWTPAAQSCNGWILNYNSASPSFDQDSGCAATDDSGNPTVHPLAWAHLSSLAYELGLAQGQNAGTASDPTACSSNCAYNNQVLSEYTNFNTIALPQADGYEFKTNSNNIPATEGHYYIASGYFGEDNCGVAGMVDASETFYLVQNGAPLALSTGLDPCTDPSSKTYTDGQYPANVAYLTSTALKLPIGTPTTLGMQVYNATADGSGNDVAFDDPAIVDATPQLDKSFSPALIAPGQTSTATLTVTNTSDLQAKNDWSISDALPAGLTFADATVGGTCKANPAAGSVAFNATESGTTINVVGGDISKGQSFCTITFDVTAAAEGTYVNGPANITTDLNPPADATLVVRAPRITLDKTLGAPREVATDQFTTQIRTGSAGGAVVNSTTNSTTTGSGSTVVAGSGTTGAYVAAADTPYFLTEAGAGGANLANYATTITCTDSYGLQTGLPTNAAFSGSLSITPVAGANISCTLSNTAQPIINLAKTSGTVSGPDASGNYTATYTVTAQNTGSVAGTYGPLIDTPAFDSNLLVTAGSWSGQTTGSASTAGPYTLAPASTAISAGAIQTYNVTVTFHYKVGATQASACGAAAGTGLYNSVSATGEDGPTTDNSACDTPPALPVANINLVKTAGSVTGPTATGNYTATYTVTATNSGTAAGTYGPLVDTPAFASNLIPTAASWTGQTTGSDSTAGPYTLAPAGTSIAAGATQTYNVTITFHYSDTTPAVTCSGSAGSGLYNSVSATGETGPMTDNAACDLPPAPPTASISLTKTPDQTTLVAGQTITYTFVATNTGKVTLTGTNIIEDSFTGSGGTPSISSCAPAMPSSLAPLATMTCTATYLVQQTDVDRGTIINHATVTGTPPYGPDVTAGAGATVPVSNAPALTVVKSANVPSVSKAGDKIIYSFEVTNTGNLTLNSIDVVDTQSVSGESLDAAPVCPDTTLAPGAATTCTATYTVTQADIDAGTVNDSAVAQGTPLTGSQVESPPSTKKIPATPAPALTVVKSASTTATPTSVSKVGDVISYSFLVTNTGNVTLTNVDVVDTQSVTGEVLDAAPVCAATTLAPLAFTTCTATYTVTQADIDAGTVDDSAIAQGTEPVTPANPTPAPTESGPSKASVPVTQAGALSVVKDSTTTEITAAGQVVPYTFTVTNNENVTISNITVTDTQVSPSVQSGMSAITCPATTLAPGASTVCTASYTVTQADVNYGSVTDTAIAHGTPPTGPPVDSPPSTKTIPSTQTGALSVVKDSTTTDIKTVGQVVPYTFTVTNNENVTISNITVTDTQVSPSVQSGMSAITCPATTLAPGASTVCTASYTVTQADVNYGSVTDTAIAHGTPPTGPPVDSPPSTKTIPATPAPALTVVKSASTTATPSAVSKVGDVISYSFLVTNTGNVTLNDVAVNDTQTSPAGALDAAPDCTDTTLAPLAFTTCTATYTVTQKDLDNGSVNDSAIAQGTEPVTPANPTPAPTKSEPSDASVPVTQAGALLVVKATTTKTIDTVGQVVPYTFVVTNNRNVTMSNIVVSDSQTAPSLAGSMSAISCPATSLAPGASTTCTANYTVSQADLDNGSVTDIASVTGTPPGSTTPVSPVPSNPVTVPATPAPELTVVKSADVTSVSNAGDKITYSFLVKNTGNVTLNNIDVVDTQSVKDEALDAAPVCSATPLAPGASTTCTATYTVTQTDIDAGTVDDSAIAQGTQPVTPANPNPTPTNSKPSDASVPVVQGPSLELVKSASPAVVSYVGDTVAYSFVVTNNGDVTISNISVDDSKFSGTGTLSAIVCPATTLVPAASTTCTATYKVTAADLASGKITNTATAQGTPPGSTTPVVSPPSTATVTPMVPGFAVSKTADPGSGNAVKGGDTITYTVTVSDTGATVLNGVHVADDLSQVINHAVLVGTPKASSGAAPKVSGTSLTWDGSLTAGEKVSITYQVKVDSGIMSVVFIDNSVTGTATPPGGPAIVPLPASTDNPVTPDAPSVPATVPPTIVPAVLPAGHIESGLGAEGHSVNTTMVSIGFGLLALLAIGLVGAVVRRRREDQPIED